MAQAIERKASVIKARRAKALADMRAELARLMPDPERSIVDEFLAERRRMWGQDGVSLSSGSKSAVQP